MYWLKIQPLSPTPKKSDPCIETGESRAASKVADFWNYDFADIELL